MKKVVSYDLSSGHWSVLPDMNQVRYLDIKKSYDTFLVFVNFTLKQVRWCHGAVVLDSRLYAVAGCGQLNSLEVGRDSIGS